MARIRRPVTAFPRARTPRSCRQGVRAVGLRITEYYFFVSDDGRELIGIDAGTRPIQPARVRSAARRLSRSAALTTVLVTQPRTGDHIGGHRYFDSLEPKPRSSRRSNYARRSKST